MQNMLALSTGYKTHKTIDYLNNKRNKEGIKWNAKYDGKNAKVKLDVINNNDDDQYNFFLNNDELKELYNDILNQPMHNIPLETRLINDYYSHINKNKRSKNNLLNSNIRNKHVFPILPLHGPSPPNPSSFKTIHSRSSPPTSIPPTSIPPTSIPHTSIPPTSIPHTSIPPTSIPPTSIPPTSIPHTSIPPPSHFQYSFHPTPEQTMNAHTSPPPSHFQYSFHPTPEQTMNAHTSPPPSHFQYSFHPTHEQTMNAPTSPPPSHFQYSFHPTPEQEQPEYSSSSNYSHLQFPHQAQTEPLLNPLIYPIIQFQEQPMEIPQPSSPEYRVYSIPRINHRLSKKKKNRHRHHHKSRKHNNRQRRHQ